MNAKIRHFMFSDFPSLSLLLNASQRLRLVVRIVGVSLSALFFVSAATADTLTIPGSGNPEYILRELASAFNRRQDQHRVVIPPTIGTSGAIREVMDGSAPMGRVGRPLQGKELNLGLTYYPLGRDPVAFVGGAGVTVSGISPQQAIDIFTGRISNWGDLGGKPAPIRAVGRELSDASRQSIMRVIKPFETIDYHQSVKVVLLDSQLIELLDRFPSSFGFLNRSALASAATRLVALKLDSIEPTAENVKSGRYPIWTEVGLIFRESSLDAAGRSFLQFIESLEGIELLRAHGLLPMQPLQSRR